MSLDQKEDFVAYEYKNITVRREFEALYVDCLKNFGWIPVEYRDNAADLKSVNLRFKRNRLIKEKSKINELQRICENACNLIQRLEKTKSSYATSVSLATGFLGTVFMALATFSYLGGKLPLCIIFALAGFPLWAAAYFVHNRACIKKTNEVNPLIDEQYEIAYKACEEASGILVQYRV